VLYYFPFGDISDCFRLLPLFPESGTGVAVLLFGVLALGVLVLLLAAPSIDFRLDGFDFGVEVSSS